MSSDGSFGRTIPELGGLAVKNFQKRTGIDNSNPTELTKVEKLSVAGDNKVGLAGQRRREHQIVLKMTRGTELDQTDCRPLFFP